MAEDTLTLRAPTTQRVLLVGERVCELRDVLKERHRVMAVAHGALALERLQQQHARGEPFDAVLMQTDLGDLTAHELLMTAREAYPTTRFVLLDDVHRTSDIVRALQAGVDGFVAAPPDLHRVLFEIARSATAPMASLDHPVRISESGENADAARVLHEVSEVLAGVLDGPLDGHEAERLRARIALGSVAATELATLREHHAEIRRERDGLRAELRHLAAEVRAARDERDRAALAHLTELAELSRAHVLELNQMEASHRGALIEACQTGQQTTDRALDLELQLEEHHTKLEFFQSEYQSQAERAARAEEALRAERQRFVEAREDAAAQHRSLFERLERALADNTELRKAAGSAAEAQTQRAQLVEQVRASEAERKRLQTDIDDTHRRAANASVEALQRDDANRLRATLSDVELRAKAAASEAALAQQTLREQLQSVQDAHHALQRELESVHHQMSTMVREVSVEQERRVAAEQSRSQLAERLTETASVMARVTAEADATRAQAALLRKEAGDRAEAVLSKEAQLNDARSEVERTKRSLQQLEQASAQLRQALDAERERAREQPPQHNHVADEQLRSELSQLKLMLRGQNPIRLDRVEELEPLRFMLGAAIEHLQGLEPREPTLALHLRHMRLLHHTLARTEVRAPT